MDDSVKIVIFKNWVLGKKFRSSIGTNDNEMVDEQPDIHSDYPWWPLILVAVVT